MSAIDWRVGELPGTLADFEDNTFHAALLDGPHGLSEDPPFDLIMRWLAGEKVRHKPGFLGREWDVLPPGPDFWREMRRVLRPGALVFSFANSRTPGLAEMPIRAGGFKILPAFAWLHAEAQALGANVGKLIDKAAGAEREVVGTYSEPDRTDAMNREPHRGLSSVDTKPMESGPPNITAPTTTLAKLFHGHHSRLRTNYEPILCAMKPLDGTYAENAAKWGCAGFDAEAGRIPTVSAKDEDLYSFDCARLDGNDRGSTIELTGSGRGDVKRSSNHSPAGRFPSSVLVEHASDCQPGACVPGCPAAALAGQKGYLRGGGWTNGGKAGAMCYGGRTEYLPSAALDPGGTADRFFFQARPARKERSAGCDGLFWARDPAHPDGWRMVTEDEPHAFEKDGVTPLGNPHPAIKSIELTRYLAALLKQPGEARLIVPFSGSGSEAIGAMLAGWGEITAIEMSEQMIEVSRRREAFWRGIMESGTEGRVKELGQHNPNQMGLW